MLPFNFAARVPEAAGPRDVAGPLSGLHVVTIEPQQHVIRWLERAWNNTTQQFKMRDGSSYKPLSDCLQMGVKP